MALTAEQQAEIQLEVDKQAFRLTAEASAGIYEKEQARVSPDRRMEAIRLARDILMENDRNKPTGERGIAASDITAFADTLLTYVNQ